MRKIFFCFSIVFAASLSSEAAWRYVDNDGSGTYSGTVRNYSSNDKPYHGYITDGNCSIWVYQHDTANHKWTIGAGGFGVDRSGGGGSLRAGTAGGSVNGDTISLYAGDIDLSDANDAIVAATKHSDAAFTVIGKRCFYGYPASSKFSIIGVPPTLEIINERAFNGANGLVNLDCRGSVLATIGYYAFESQGSATEQEFWFPDTLATLAHRCLAYGPSKRSIHFLGDVPGFTSEAAADGTGAIYPGANKQWAYCVNALKYPDWASHKVGEFNTDHQSWIPSAVRYKNASDKYAVDETTGAVTYPMPFGTTLFGTSGTETYLIQEGFAGESAVPTYSLTAPARDATTATFGVTLITLPTGAESATLTLEIATDADFTAIVKTGTVTLDASGATGTIAISGLAPASTYYARLSGADNEGGEGEVSATVSFNTYLGKEGSYWISNAPNADPALVTASYVYYLYSTDGAWTIPIRVSGGVWQIGNNLGNENDTVCDSSKGDGTLNLSTVVTETGIVLESVNGATFYNRGATDVTLPASLKATGQSMFALCASLTNAVLPAALETLAGGIFRSTSKLKSVNFADLANLTTIGGGVGAFYQSGITNADLRATQITAIPGGAFQDCLSLSEVWLPDTLETVGDIAFGWGPSKRAIHFRSAPPELTGSGDGSFYPGNVNTRYVYFVDNIGFPEWNDLIDGETPYDAATMAMYLPEGLNNPKILGTTKYGTKGANAILVYEKVVERKGLIIFVR